MQSGYLLANDIPFKLANKSYNGGNYQDALQSYKAIKNKDGATWYNMGNAAYHMHDFPHAYLYWLRAQKYGNSLIFNAATQNIEHVLIAQGKDGYSLWDRFYLKLLSFSKYKSLFIWQILCVTLWSMLLWALLFCDNRRFRTLIIGVLLMACIMLFIIVAVAYSSLNNQAIVLEDADVYNGPNSSFYVLGRLPKGALISIKKADKRWYKITYNDIGGWIDRDALAKI